MGNHYSKSVKEAVGLLSSKLSDKDKQAIRNIREQELSLLQTSLWVEATKAWTEPLGLDSQNVSYSALLSMHLKK